MSRIPELLAPAGHVESFHAAIESGANAVYLGLKRLSARATATNFSLDELAVLVPYAHRRDVSVYVALNSLVTVPELSGALDLLQSLQDIAVDALIVQDPAFFFLVRHHFPKLRLHASTLMTVHNHAGVNVLQRMGARRVVLARELNLKEIEEIAARTTAELEIFVHGALCYSYSGLCLTSSFRGGHSGLQGQCVQPCRLRFTQGRKEGFFLSCNDLCALPLIPRLKRMRIASFKIEGRMKQADYIGRVVRAYRLVLDAPPGREEPALAEAQELLAQSPSRRLSSGFLGEDASSEVLTPHRSGSSGLWIGTIKAVEAGRILVALRHDLHTGDRLRPESLQGREKEAFTVTALTDAAGRSLPEGGSGKSVHIKATGDLRPGERLFRVGTRTRPASAVWQSIRRQVPRGASYAVSFPAKDRMWENWPLAPNNPRSAEETLILKIGAAQELSKALQSPAAFVMLTASRANLERLAKQKLIPAQKKRFIWSLPPLIGEKEMEYYRAAVRWYCDKGFRAWELNNWGHLDLFGREEGLTLVAGARFNIRNPAASAAVAQAGCQWSVLSMEITREELQLFTQGALSTIPIVTVYAWPPLFTSRLVPKLEGDKPLLTPRKDVYLFRKRSGTSFIYADRPMNWFEQLPALRAYGYRSFLIDLSDGPEEQTKDFDRLLSGFKRQRADEPYSLFNLDRKPS